MEKVTLTAVYHQSANKEGKPYIGKNGRPYERCSIKTAQHGDKYLGGFGSKVTHSWKEGDEVELIVTQNGEYLNFELPKVEAGGYTELDRERDRRIEQVVTHTNQRINAIYKHLGIEEKLTAGNTSVPYPTPEQEGIAEEPTFGEDEPKDIPF